MQVAYICLVGTLYLPSKCLQGSGVEESTPFKSKTESLVLSKPFPKPRPVLAISQLLYAKDVLDAYTWLVGTLYLPLKCLKGSGVVESTPFKFKAEFESSASKSESEISYFFKI